MAVKRNLIKNAIDEVIAQGGDPTEVAGVLLDFVKKLMKGNYKPAVPKKSKKEKKATKKVKKAKAKKEE